MLRKTTAAYNTKPNKGRKSEKVKRRERDQFKFIYLGFERWQVPHSGKEEEGEIHR